MICYKTQANQSSEKIEISNWQITFLWIAINPFVPNVSIFTYSTIESGTLNISSDLFPPPPPKPVLYPFNWFRCFPPIRYLITNK